MPELPEVETIRRHLAPPWRGGGSRRVEVARPALDARRWRPPTRRDALSRAGGSSALDRRGKYCSGGLAASLPAQHLRMTGTVLYDPAAASPTHVRVRLALDDGHGLVFVDPRRFGTGQLLGAGRRGGYLDSRLGSSRSTPGSRAEHLHALTRGRRAPVKPFVLDQRRVAGVGNIYADEALFRARHPPAAPGRAADAAAGGRAARGVAPCSRGDRRPRGVDRRLPGSRRRARARSRTRSACTCGRASRARRCGTADPQDRRRRAGDLRVRACQPRPRRRRGGSAPT